MTFYKRQKTNVMEIRSLTGIRNRSWRFTAKENKGNFRDYGNVLQLDCDGGYMIV